MRLTVEGKIEKDETVLLFTEPRHKLSGAAEKCLKRRDVAWPDSIEVYF
jgi:hypothetical protein